jgi:hypothetical protein
LLFGVVYSETTATFRKAIFAVAAGLLITAAALFTLLRRDVMPHSDAEAEPLVRQDRDEEGERDEEGAVPLLGVEGESGPSSDSRK